MLKTIKNTISTENTQNFVVFHIRSFRYISLYQKSSLKMHGPLKILNPYGQLRCENDKILHIYPRRLVLLSFKHQINPIFNISAHFDCFLARNSGTRFFPDCKLGKRIGDHKSPLQTKNRPKLMKSHGDIVEKLLFWPRLTRYLDPKIFFQKSGFVTYFTLSNPKTMQKIRKIQSTNLSQTEIRQTDQPTIFRSVSSTSWRIVYVWARNSKSVIPMDFKFYTYIKYHNIFFQTQN